MALTSVISPTCRRLTLGGILIAAKQSDVSISDVLAGCYSITVLVRPTSLASGDNFSWWLSSVLFLEELEAIRDACPGPWAVCADFNLILTEADKNNQRLTRMNLARFWRTVASLELQDLHLYGCCFTWSNERKTQPSSAWIRCWFMFNGTRCSQAPTCAPSDHMLPTTAPSS